MDNLYRIQAVSPELAALIIRARTVYAVCGGEVHTVAEGKKDDFQARKSILIAKIRELESLVDARDNSGLSHTSPAYIRLKRQVDSKVQEIEDSVKACAEINAKEIKRDIKSMKPEDIRARTEVMESIRTEFYDAFKRAKGGAHTGSDEFALSGGGGGGVMLSKDQVMKGQFHGAGVKVQREEITGEQAQKLAMIQQQRQVQDSVLEEMGKMLDDLKDVADRMGDELTTQNKMLEDLEGKTEKVQGKLDATNDRMKDVLKSLNDKSSNACVYIICIVLLLGIVTVAYNMIVKK